ncbi:MAG: glucokinase [Methylophaga sp.]|nr:glucokinase [Methylophaga sp.]
MTIIGLWIKRLLVNKMSTLLAADIGGTKTLLQISSVDGAVLCQQRFVSGEFLRFEDLLAGFLYNLPADYLPIESACLAVAGPVSGRTAKVTNLPWLLDADVLCRALNIGQVLLINDFAAVGEGIAYLNADDLMVLQTGLPDLSAPRAVIGAGTGLGQAFMTPIDDGWQVWATEGGHTDFAPTDALQQQLLDFLLQQYVHVSYERLVSGMGLVNIYQFLSDLQQTEAAFDPTIDLPAHISALAQQKDPLATQTMALFVDIYGAQAGNLALSVMPRGGLYLAGGIASKNQALFTDGKFIQAFLAKGRMQTLLETIPLYLIKSDETGLRGAALLARKALYNEAHDRLTK